jgi:putative ABC transport system permease protein
MFQHNLLLIYRNFKRFKSTFLINLIGLSTGLASALLIYLWVSDELSVDKFHEKDSQLFQVVERIQMPDQIVIAPYTVGLLAEAIEEKIPEVEYAVSSRLFKDDKILSVGDKSIKATGLYASQDFFNMFSYKLKQGDEDRVLTDKSAIVISEELAMNLFTTSESSGISAR